jgi:hypothetical protein
MTRHSLLLLAMVACAAMLWGCGGGGSGSAVLAANAANAANLQGTVSDGKPLNGTVYLSDSSNPTQEVSAAITAAGEYTIPTTGLKAPFILKAVDSAGIVTLFSYADRPGTANINPVSTLAMAVADAADTIDTGSLIDLYRNYHEGTGDAVIRMQNMARGMGVAFANVSATLKPLYAVYGVETVNPVTDPFVVDHKGLDGLFENVAFALSGGSSVITARNSRAPIFRATLVDLKASRQTENVDTARIPNPTTYIQPGNSSLTLRIVGSLPAGTLIRNASFILQLPVGISVNTDSANQSNAAVVNTAMPIGPATGSNVYPAPTLSPNNDSLKVNISSLSGFGSGDFLTIRYVESSSVLQKKRTAADFVVSGTAVYSDIYKSQALKGLTIIPVGISY